MLSALLQTVGSAEVSAGWGGLQLIGSGIAAALLTALSGYAINFLRGKGELVKKDLELKAKDLDLKSKEQELKQLEVEEKIAGIRKRIAMDAVAVVEEQSRGGTLSGPVKAELAAAKVEELLSESAAPNVEGSMLTDLVKLGVSELRKSGTTFHMITPSMAPPPEKVNLRANRPEQRFPAPARMPEIAPSTLTKTSPERPGAKR